MIAARKQVEVIQHKFNKTSKLLGERNIGRLALAKPKPIQKIINNGTSDMFRCFEIISGSSLTEKEVNVEKKSKKNDFKWARTRMNIVFGPPRSNKTT